MRTKILILFTLTVFFYGCSEKDLNLPQPSPMPEREVPQVQLTSCEFAFTQNQSFAEVAVAASEMQEHCGYTSDEVLSLARRFTGKTEQIK